MIEDYGSCRLALLPQLIDTESESDYAVQLQTSVLVQKSLQYAHAIRLWVKHESARLIHINSTFK